MSHAALNLRNFGPLLVVAVAWQMLATGLSAEKAPPAAKAPAAPDLTLVIDSPIDDQLAPIVGRLAGVFYESYPKLLARFDNPKAPAARTVHLVFARGLKAPGVTSQGTVTISIDWITAHPNDLGLLTHELTHIVQAYPTPEPGWVTEGIADYARHLYGPHDQGGWKLPETLDEKQSYKNSYGVAARFFVWLETQHAGTVDKIHRRMQQHKFKIEDFKEFTGQDVDTLWAQCVRDLNK